MSRQEGAELSQDAVFDILSNSRRRFLLSRLQQAQEPKRLMELADEIAAWENDTTVEALSDKESKRVYVSVYQTHVPKLEDAGLITYDSETGVIELSESAREVERYMPDSEEGSRPWARYYVGLAGVAAVLYALVIASVPGTGLLSAPFVAAAVVVAFAGLSIAHFVVSNREDRAMTDLPVENER